MAYQVRKLILGAVGGFLAAVLIISGIVGVGIMPGVEVSWPGTQPGVEVPLSGAKAEVRGLLVIKVKDAPPAVLNELWLNVTGVKVHKKGGGNETWYDVPLFENEPSKCFDLLSYRDVGDDLAYVLVVSELEVGNYTEIRFHVDSANATIDGVPDQPLRITTKWVMVKVHFTIEEVPVTSVVIDIEVREQPILKAGILMPVVKATVNYA